MKLQPAFLVFSVSIFCALTTAQQAKPAQAQSPQRQPRLDTPEVHSDNSVTFRFLAPNAQEVKLAREGADPAAMQKDDKGVWTVNTPPLPPDYYGYSIVADGVRSLDPYNHGLVPNLISPPTGCRFHPRCPKAFERCPREKPPLIEFSPGHFVECFLYGG